MKSPHHIATILICLAGAAAGSGIGWMLRGSSASANSALSGASETEQQASPTSNADSAKHAQSKETASFELENILSIPDGPMRWLMLLGAAEKATPAQMANLMEAARSLPGGEKMLSARWAALDPQHMFETLGKDKRNYHALNFLFTEWASSDPEQAIAALSDVRKFSTVADLRSQFLANLFETDPARTIQMMHQWHCRYYSNETKAFKEWVKKDPRAAAEAVAQSPGKDGGVHYFRPIGRIWAETNPAAALQYAVGKSGHGAETLMETVLKQWAQKDLKSAAQAVGQISDPHIRNQASVSIVGELAKSDPKAAMAWVEQNLRGAHQRNAMTSIVASLTEQSPATTQQFIDQLEPGPSRSQALRAYLNNNTLFNMEPAVASGLVTWISSLPDENERNSALADALPFVLRKAPEAIHEVMNKPGANYGGGLYEMYAHHLASINPANALKWVETVPAPIQTNLVSSILSTWSSQRPAEAMDWVRQQPNGSAKDRIVHDLSREFATRSFEADLPAWLESLPATDRKTALKSIEGIALPPEKKAALQKWQ